MIGLGDKVRDKVTGLEGIVIARTEWMYGCVRLIVQPQKLHDGKPVDNYTIDEPQAELIQAGAIQAQVAAPEEPRRRSYGDRPSVHQRSTPRR
jgi:hypothetical protein